MLPLMQDFPNTDLRVGGIASALTELAKEWCEGGPATS